MHVKWMLLSFPKLAYVILKVDLEPIHQALSYIEQLIHR